MLRMAFTSCYSPLLLLPVSFRKSFVPPPSPLPVPCPPFFAFKYSVVVYKKRLITLETQWNAAYCSTAALSKIITAVGNNNVCLLVRFSGDVGCVLRPHGRAIVAGRRLPSGAGTKTKKLFSPSLYRATELTDSLVSYSVAASWLYCSDSNCDIDGILSVAHWTA